MTNLECHTVSRRYLLCVTPSYSLPEACPPYHVHGNLESRRKRPVSKFGQDILVMADRMPGGVLTE